MRLAYQYRLKPNKTQQQMLQHLLCIACQIYNDALKERKEAWEKEQRTVTYYDQAMKLKEKRVSDKELALLNFSAAQQVLRRLDKAFKRFFEG
jgi:putative transposase